MELLSKRFVAKAYRTDKTNLGAFLRRYGKAMQLDDIKEFVKTVYLESGLQQNTPLASLSDQRNATNFFNSLLRANDLHNVKRLLAAGVNTVCIKSSFLHSRRDFLSVLRATTSYRTRSFALMLEVTTDNDMVLIMF